MMQPRFGQITHHLPNEDDRREYLEFSLNVDGRDLCEVRVTAEQWGGGDPGNSVLITVIAIDPDPPTVETKVLRRLEAIV